MNALPIATANRLGAPVLRENQSLVCSRPRRLLPVTYQVFVSWAGRETSDRTSTESLRIAEFAFSELAERQDIVRDGAQEVQLTKVVKAAAQSRIRDFQAKLSHRVYVRWPDQRVSDRTSTDSSAVAKLAFSELMAKGHQLMEDGALSILMSVDGERVELVDLAVEFGARKDN